MNRSHLTITSSEEYDSYIEELELIEDWKEEGYSWDEIAKDLDLGSEAAARRYHKKLVELRDNPPEGLEHIDFTREALAQAIEAKSTKKKRYIISTITANAKTNRNAFQALYKASKELGAELVLLLGRSHNRPLQKQIWHYDPWLKNYQNKVTFVHEYVFNDSIRAVDLQINPQQLNPLTGIKGIDWGKESSSVIIASTQIALEAAARGNGRTPRVIAGTGTISMPKYLKDTRTGVMAEQNHDFGAIMLEVVNDSRFFLRILEIDGKSGVFYDIANGKLKEYGPNGSKAATAEGWVLGDKHIGYDCAMIWEAQKELAKMIKPKNFVLHDLIDGNSISHHTWKKPLIHNQRPFFSIQDELNSVKSFLDEMNKLLPKAKGFMVDSNHNDHITRYLQEGRYTHDKINFEIAHRMVVEMLDGKNPLQLRCDPNKSLKWLGHKDDHYIQKVNIAMHGHRGPNGSRGSIKNIAEIERYAMIGHSHTPGWYRGIVQVGHSSAQEHGYNEGPSSWITADGLIFPKGLKGLIMFMDGEFYLKK